jgi:chorismate mutase
VGLISGLLTLPIAPLRGVVTVAEQVRKQAEDEFYDPARIRQQLDDVSRRRESGDLGDDEATALEDELVERLLEGRGRREGSADGW